MKGREVGMKIMEKNLAVHFIYEFYKYQKHKSKYFLSPTGKIKSRYRSHNQSRIYHKLVQNVEIWFGKQIQNIIDITFFLFLRVRNNSPFPELVIGLLQNCYNICTIWSSTIISDTKNLVSVRLDLFVCLSFCSLNLQKRKQLSTMVRK